MRAERNDEASAAVEQREKERQQGEERLPATPDRIAELSIRVGARPVEDHVGACWAARKRHRAITREQALAALAAFETAGPVPWLDLTTWSHRQQRRPLPHTSGQRPSPCCC
ncbi:DUF6233 domain-containing protein [Streptomyces sp900116325]|uniref:DUF6233 domain-containing protein n=1 Tax=Streptomyces sp. 900116325 TaxID=3154295 RepID=UPI0033B1DFCC